MASESLSLPIVRPVSVWNKPVRVDFKGLFFSVAKAVAQGLTGNWGDMIAAPIAVQQLSR